MNTVVFQESNPHKQQVDFLHDGGGGYLQRIFQGRYYWRKRKHQAQKCISQVS